LTRGGWETSRGKGGEIAEGRRIRIKIKSKIKIGINTL
jgi:hypothetical protein